jgi:hypothetical protein
MSDFIRCQCPDSGFDHAAHGCRKTARYTVIRDGKRGGNGPAIHVCGDCILSGDTDLTKRDDDGLPIPPKASDVA